MIAFVRGHFAMITPQRVIVDVNGVGYELNISGHTYAEIQGNSSGQLFTYLHITENAQSLYGFSTMGEKELFLQLISISGVGANTARMILSGMRPEEIIRAIVQQQTKQLEGIKGIGKKTAERLVLELKDKLVKHHQEQVANIPTVSSPQEDAIHALIALGISRPLAEQTVKKTIQSLSSPIETEEIIKLALKNL